ncbi:MAG: hypothetical protein HYS06_07650 [Methylocystis sp.]|nr:hypothetical protein [Methylocystis sp.]
MNDTPTPSPRRAFGRSWSDFQPTEAETKLAEAAGTGEGCVLGNEVPEKATLENTIRAGFLRFLALGGDESTPVHETGVRLRYAFIKGALDLLGAKLPFDLTLQGCRFDSPIVLQGARGRTISLEGSHLVGFMGDRLRLDGGLFLLKVHAAGATRLAGARIKGDFTCSGGKFNSADGSALHFDGAEIGGAVFLNGGFHARGATRLAGARIAGDLTCNGGRFENAGDYALACDNAKIDGALFFCNEKNAKGENFLAHAEGIVSFAHAEIGTLRDDPALWSEHSLHLEGFRYQRITSMSPLDAKTRIKWLYKQQKRFLEGENFALQPWTHLAKVLREQGHFREAADVDIAREDLLREVGRIAPRPSLRGWWKYLLTPVNERAERDPKFSTSAQAKLLLNLVPWVAHWFYGRFSGYGYKPECVVYIAFASWLGFAALYSCAASRGVFAPSSPPVFQNKDYEHCRPEAPATPANGKAKIGNWTKCPGLPGEYTSFSALAYSADLILPVVSLSQAKDWTPITEGDPWLSLGYWVRRATWFEEIFGWVAALTLAAIASGLVKRRDGE